MGGGRGAEVKPYYTEYNNNNISKGILWHSRPSAAPLASPITTPPLSASVCVVPCRTYTIIHAYNHHVEPIIYLLLLQLLQPLLLVVALADRLGSFRKMAIFAIKDKVKKRTKRFYVSSLCVTSMYFFFSLVLRYSSESARKHTPSRTHI